MRQDSFSPENPSDQEHDAPVSTPLPPAAPKTTASIPRNVQTFGQVFTPSRIVDTMLALRRNTGRILEPSCGNGMFSDRLPDCIAIEIDPLHAPAGSLNIDFFAYSDAEKFETIIGNPPYVRNQDITPGTRSLIRSDLFDLRTNLYLFFIEKAVRHLTEHGELIFITPRDFLKTTSSMRMNRWLYAQGTITHAIELGDARAFPTALPNCLIWRYEKGRFDRTVRYAEIGNKVDLQSSLESPHWEDRLLVEKTGHLMFSSNLHAQHMQVLQMKDIASIRVGAVSGDDRIFSSKKHGTRDFVFSGTIKNGKTRRMIWVADSNEPPECLLRHKKRLLARKITTYTEADWWHWGRSYPMTDAPRVYVNGKTRHPTPFFLHDCKNFDGAILAIFPHDPNIDMQAFCAELNAVQWDQLGFICDGRFIFGQRSLENAPLPEIFRRFLPQPEAADAVDPPPEEGGTAATCSDLP